MMELGRATAALAVAALSLVGVDASAAEMKCTESGGQRTLRYDGGVDGGDADKFMARFQECFESRYKGQVTVLLNSGGGSVNAALKMSDFMVDYSKSRSPVATLVPQGGHCISACTYMFAAGTIRKVEKGGSLEPHGFSAFLGPRIDMAMAGVVTDATSTGKPRPAIMFGDKDYLVWLRRFLVLLPALEPTLRADKRLTWVLGYDFSAQLSNDELAQRITDAINGFAEPTLSTDQRRLLIRLDSLMAISLPEIERLSALGAFSVQFAQQYGSSEQDAETLRAQAESETRWLAGQLVNALQSYLASTKGKPISITADSLLPGLRTALKANVDSTSATVNNDLGPYLSSRGSDIDVQAFVKLMFSTSILYTRPLTREELCDLNLVNWQCE